jgi:hypothetical protein
MPTMSAPRATHPNSHRSPRSAARDLTGLTGPEPPEPPEPPYRQLSLPLAEVPPLAPTNFTPSAAMAARTTVVVPPQEVWQGLSPQAQARLRQTVVHVLEEVIHNGHDAGE